MKMVIEVSEKDYLDFMLQYDSGILDEKTPSHRAKIAIANGTPLPKGHGDLIDRSKLEMSDIAPDPWYRPIMAYTEWTIDDAEVVVEADKEGADNGTEQ